MRRELTKDLFRLATVAEKLWGEFETAIEDLVNEIAVGTSNGPR
jgi:hypothetical protein